uniref:Uncharacterized protein n=1 Tax=Anguilla anguilla TaxID=7936 RepID=A0A0E9PER5_ANGAN
MKFFHGLKLSLDQCLQVPSSFQNLGQGPAQLCGFGSPLLNRLVSVQGLYGVEDHSDFALDGPPSAGLGRWHNFQCRLLQSFPSPVQFPGLPPRC